MVFEHSNFDVWFNQIKTIPYYYWGNTWGGHVALWQLIFNGHDPWIDIVYIHTVRSLFSSRFNFIKLQLADFLNPMCSFPQDKTEYYRLPIMLVLSVSTTASLWSGFILHCSCNKVFLISDGVEEDSIIFIKKHEAKVTILYTRSMKSMFDEIYWYNWTIMYKIRD